MRRRALAQRVSSRRLDSWSLRSTAAAWVSTVRAEMRQPRADLLVRVAGGDQAQHLALAAGELVELRVPAAPAGRPGRRRARSRPAAARSTTSPACTRRIASHRSGPEIAFVTYPRAPPRMTPMTSSAASETDRPGNGPAGGSARRRRGRPGRRRRAGARRAGPRRAAARGCREIAEATSAASPTTSTASPISARTPERTSAWSSTTKTLIRSARTARSRQRHAQLHLGARARRRADRGRAAVASHAPLDRVGDAAAGPAGLRQRWVEPAAPVADQRTTSCPSATSANTETGGPRRAWRRW